MCFKWHETINIIENFLDVEIESWNSLIKKILRDSNFRDIVQKPNVDSRNSSVLSRHSNGESVCKTIRLSYWGQMTIVCNQDSSKRSEIVGRKVPENSFHAILFITKEKRTFSNFWKLLWGTIFNNLIFIQWSCNPLAHIPHYLLSTNVFFSVCNLFEE